MRIVLFTGKGGVGKTTTSAATALRLADEGHRVLLMSTDAAHSLGDALRLAVDAEPTPVTSGLDAVQIDTQRRLEDRWREVQEYFTHLLAHGGVDPVTAEELTVLPGVEEVLALLAVKQYADAGRWDVLVLDCAPTAETLRLLALPDALRWYLDRVFPAQRRIAKSVRPFVTMLGHGAALPPDALFDALLRLSADLADVRLLLGDPSTTTVRLVLTPEAVVTAEARRTFTALALYGYGIDLVVANRVFPAGEDPWRQTWAAAQARQLAAVRDSFGDVPVRELAYRPGEPVGPTALREVAAELYASVPALPSAVIGAPLMQVSAEESGYLLRLRLPGATRGDVQAARAGDELVVTVGGHRRIVALPTVLRGAPVLGGGYRDDELRVRFGPDPAREHRRPRPGPGAARGRRGPR